MQLPKINRRDTKLPKLDNLGLDKLTKELIRRNPLLVNPILKRNRLDESDIELDNISRRLSFSLLNPINVESEMKKFMKETSYNPLFEYQPIKEDLDKLLKRTKKVKADKSVVGKIILEIRDHYVNYIEMMNARGIPKKFTEMSVKVYGRPDEKLMNDAKKFIRLKTKYEKKVYSSKEVIVWFRLAFLLYGVPWTIKEKKMIVNATVKPSTRELHIKKNARFSKNFLKRLIVHEIGTHAMRAENGRMQPYLFFRRGFPGYLTTEEGLAVINEELNNCLDDHMLKIYAGRVIAVHTAMRFSFAETYALLRKYFNKRDAVRLTLRAKRGITDTEKPGACTKDISYLKGYIEIKKYMEDGGSLSKLYYGKVSLRHIDDLDRIGGLINPVILPMFRRTNYLVQHFSRLLKSIIFFDIGPSIAFFKKVNRKFKLI